MYDCFISKISMGSGPPDSPSYNIRAQWDPLESAFEPLNVESAKEYITVAVDLVIKGIREPLRSIFIFISFIFVIYF